MRGGFQEGAVACRIDGDLVYAHRNLSSAMRALLGLAAVLGLAAAVLYPLLFREERPVRGESAVTPLATREEPAEGERVRLADPPPREVLRGAGSGGADEAEELETQARPSPPKQGAAPTTQGDALLQQVSGLAESFLTEDPDVHGLDDLFSHLAVRADVDEESVSYDAASGRTTGRIVFEGSELVGRFEIAGSGYRIEMDSGAEELPRPFLMRDLSLSFLEDEGSAANARYLTQFHPDTRKSAAEVLEPGEDALAGWSFSSQEHGYEGRPIGMRRTEGGAWQIGDISLREAVVLEGYAPVAPSVWLDVLAAYRR